MKRVLIVLAALAVVGTLAGCAEGDPNRTRTDSGWVTAQFIDLPDGRQVICVMSDTKISCDWGSAK